MRAAVSIATPLLCAVALLTPRAWAGGGVTLTWAAPAGCPTEAEARAAMERLIGRPLRGESGKQAEVRIAIASAGERAWKARVTIAGSDDAAPQERLIDGETCAAAADAAIVAAALAIEPPAPPPPAPAPPPPAPAPPPPAPKPQAPAEPPEPPADRPAGQTSRLLLRPGMRVLAGVDFGSLPAPSPGVEIAALLSFGDNRVELRGAAWMSQETTLSFRPATGATFSLFVGGARYCRTFFRVVLELAGCAGLEAGALRGKGFGVMLPGAATSPWIAPGLGLLGLWSISSRFAISFGAEGLVPAARPSFTLGGLGEIYRPPAFTGRGLLGLQVTFR
jgi:hypothetical protein